MGRPSPLSLGFIMVGGGGKYLIDLWRINERILALSGLKKENIEISGLCTKCESDLFWSHRLSGENRGGMAAFMELGKT